MSLKTGMKYIYQFAIIMAITLAGELLNRVVPLPVPASIYGMLILFAALMTGVIKLSAVKETGSFLIQILPLMFIPPAVGLLDAWGVMQKIIIAILVIALVSTVLVIAVSGNVTQYIIERKKRKEAGDEGNA